MNPQPDNRRSPVKGAKRLAEIRAGAIHEDNALCAGYPVSPELKDVCFLLDHIDALTAERDALRATYRASFSCAYCISARQQSPGVLEGCLQHFPLLKSSPSPVEDGES